MKRRFFIRNGVLVPAAMLVAPKLFSAIPFPLVSSKKAGSGGGAPCTTLQQTNGDTSFDDWFDFASHLWFATPFTGSGTFTCCRIDPFLIKVGTVAAGTLTAYIYTDSGGSPGSVVGSGTNALDRTTVGGSASYVQITGASSGVTAVSLWLVLKASALDTDGSNGVWWVRKNNAAVTNKLSDDGTTWGITGTGNLGFKLYSI